MPPAQKYRVAEKNGVLAREGAAMNSSPAGKLNGGEIITALESKKLPTGVVRVRFEGRVTGWASIKAGDGTTLLEKVSGTAAAPPPTKPAQSKGGSSKGPPLPKVGTIFTVVEKRGVLARAGFAMNTSPVGQLKAGEKVTVLQAKLNDKNVPRLRFKGRITGWASVKAGDGSVLLQEDNGQDTE